MKITGGFKEYQVDDEYIEHKLFSLDSHGLDAVLYFRAVLRLINSDRHKIIVCLLYAGFTKKETADILNIHPSAISKAIKRSIKPAMDEWKTKQEQ